MSALPGTGTRGRPLAWLAILVVAFLLRLPSVWAALPYLGYVDEGHVLRRVVQMLHRGGWYPRWYLYPSLPLQAMAGATRLYAPVYAARHGEPLRAGLSWPPRRYDLVEPAAVIVVSRVVTLLVGLGVVLMTGRLAALLAGEAAGLLAAWLAALVPALVIRGAVVSVDPYATLFVLAALLFTERAAREGGPWRDAALAGAACGLALCCKYPAALVALPVGIGLLRLRERAARALVLAGAAGALATLASMPGLLWDQARVIEHLGRQQAVYRGAVMGSFWEQALRRAEWDQPLESAELGLPFLLAALGGAVIAARTPQLRWTVIAWAAFAAALLALFLCYDFRPFRNLLPLVPLGCVLAALAVELPRRRSGRSGAWLWAAAAAAALCLLPASVAYARARWGFEDSRQQAVRWLHERAAPADLVLVAAELGLPRSELRLLGAPTVLAFPAARWQLRHGADFRFVLSPDLGEHGRDLADLAAEGRTRGPFVQVARFGELPLEPRRLWRGNRQIVYVLETMVPRSEARASEAPRAPTGSSR